jgi:lipid-A-disaccharide synthase-like uncharacterized protein
VNNYNWYIYIIGFIAQGLFSSRLIIQWFLSEKQKKVVTPSLFWVLSLLASFMLFVYGYLRDDFAIMLGQSLTYFIYIRNLQLQGKWEKIHTGLRWLIYVVPVALVVYYFNNNIIDVDKLLKNEAIPPWLLSLGIVSQILFTFRFVYQWLYSEKHKESTLPMGFWLLSNLGALLILIYAIIRKDPVLFVGHLMGISIYTRNIILLVKQND